MFCIHCGTKLPEGTKFCTTCGKPTDEEDDAPQQVGNASTTQIPQQAEPASMPTMEIPRVADGIDAQIYPGQQAYIPLQQDVPVEKKGNRNVILVVVLVVAIVILAVFGLLLFLNLSGNGANQSASTATASSSASVSTSTSTQVVAVSSSSATASASAKTSTSTQSASQSTATSNATSKLPESNPYRTFTADYVFANSSSSLLTDSQINGLNEDSARVARNEIAARHGRIFNDENLSAYFNSKSWYKGTVDPDTFDKDTDAYYNSAEKTNLDKIVALEESRHYNGK